MKKKRKNNRIILDRMAEYTFLLNFEFNIFRPTISFIIRPRGISVISYLKKFFLYDFELDDLIKKIPHFLEKYIKTKEKFLSTFAISLELSKRSAKNIIKAYKKLTKWENQASSETKLLLELI